MDDASEKKTTNPFTGERTAEEINAEDYYWKSLEEKKAISELLEKVSEITLKLTWLQTKLLLKLNSWQSRLISTKDCCLIV